MLLFLLLACPSGQQTVGCPDYSADECASYAECTTIEASPLTWSDDGTCYDIGGSEPVGCMAADLGCDDVITWAGPGDGTCYEFGDGCTPGGWVACDPSPATGTVCEG